MTKKVTEQIGKTVEEAIRKGLEELKVSRDDVKIEVLEEPSNGGVLGILSAKLAKVRLTVDKKISDEQAQKTQDRLEEILKNMFDITNEQVSYTITKEGNQLNLVIKGDEMAHLIGYKSRTIEAFQSLLNSMLQREDEEYAKVFVEINDYKKKKEEKLRKLANKMAANCVKFRRPIKLEPMSAYERLIIHNEIAKRDDVETEYEHKFRSLGNKIHRFILRKE